MSGQIKASDLFVSCLEKEGVEFIFAIPGEENIDFLESLRGSAIRLVLVRHEQAGGFMAATYGRLTGKTGVCLSTLGPGATNLVTSAAYAQLGAMPMLMITGQKPIKKSKQGRFQIVDIVEMMQPLTKFTKQVVNGNLIPALVREAFRIAEKERPGAVHIELPEDIASEQTDNDSFQVTKVRRPAPDPKAIAKAVDEIHKAKHPLLLIGAGANRKRTGNALTRMIDQLGIPFVNTQMGKGVVDERHPLFIGTASLSSKDFVHCAIEHADLILNVGHDVIEKPPFFMHGDRPRVIHINFIEADIDEVYFPQVEVIGDIANSIWQLTDDVSRKSWDLTGFMTVKKELDNHISSQEKDDSFPMRPERVVADVRACLPDDGIVALDNGVYKIWFSRNYRAYHPNTLILDNALASMGAGLPSAMAAALVYPERKVVAVCGDGGFMMNSQEIETAIRSKIDVTILILRDDAYGMIKWKQLGMGFGEYGLDYGNPDFELYAKSYGANGYRVSDAEGLQKVLGQCLANGGVNLIDVPVDYSHNHRILNEEIGVFHDDLAKRLNGEGSK